MSTATLPELQRFEIDAPTARRWLDESPGRTVLIDVREPDEHAAERIGGSRLAPLSQLDPVGLGAMPCDRIVLHCKGGKRSAEALKLLLASGLQTPAYSMAGGIGAWKESGLPTITGAGPRLSIMRQVQLVVGTVVLGASLLANFVHPAFALLAGAAGLGLTIAGATGTCMLASALAALPFNRIPNMTQSTSAAARCGGSCANTKGA